MSSDADIVARLRQAAEAEDRQAVFAALGPLWPKVGEDARVAQLWAEALRTSPSRPTLLDEARTIVEAWPGDPTIVGAACDALIRLSERSPLDEPPAAPEAGALAAEAAGRCWARLPESERATPEVGGSLLALKGNALRTLGPKRLGDAAKTLERAIALEPRGAWLFDLSIVHKRARDWDEALAASRRATAQLGHGHRGAAFNLAIAATAMGDGDTAADAWRSAGISVEIEPGRLPFVSGLPPAQVRLPTLGSGHVDAHMPDQAAGFEAVWVQPLSPCHGVVRSPTHREAAADFGDLILWDPVPVSVVEREGTPVPRFPLLTVLRPGDERRFRFMALEQREGQVRALGEALPEGAFLYPHGERVEVVCPRCAAGEVMRKHEHLPEEEHRIVFGKLIVPAALELPQFALALEATRKAHPGVRMAIPGLYEALGDTPQAGKHHKRWGTIERTVSR